MNRFPLRRCIGSILILAGAAAASARAQEPASEQLTEHQKAIHVLNRTGYGPRPGDIERVLQMGIKAYLEEQLNPQRIDDRSVERDLAQFDTLTMTSKQLMKAYPPPSQRRRQEERRRMSMEESGKSEDADSGKAQSDDARQRRRQDGSRRQQMLIYSELAGSRLIRAVESQRQLQEVMVDFWANHFNVFILKGFGRYLTTEYEREVLRPLAFGRFEDLLLATAQSPAMLFYLDNWVSSAPQEVVRSRLEQRYPFTERLFREQEKGREGFRSRSDRRGLLRNASSQWRRMSREERNRMRREVRSIRPLIRRAKGLNENYARELLELHTVGVDAGYTQQDVIEVAKILSGWSLAPPPEGPEFEYWDFMHVGGDKTVMGRRFASGGRSEGEALIRFLANHPSTARFISAKLVRRFVADDPPQALVERAAATFLRTGGQIREVLRTIFTSPEFLSPAAYRSKLKKPLDLVASTLRAADARIRNPRPALRALRELGEPLYLQQAPIGYPDTADAWLNTNSLLQRLNFAIALASGSLRGVDVDMAAARRLLQGIELPEPGDEQMKRTQELMEKQISLPDSTSNDRRKLILASAFQLGSPQFQKR